MNANFRMLRIGALVTAGLLAGALTAGAAVITIINTDGPGEGFNDPTVVAPVGGNPGTTLGAQRLFLFSYAASIWGSVLPSPVTIMVNASFDPLTCSATSAVLGSAGATTVYRDFPGAPFAGTWYNVALANRLYGSDLDGGTTADIVARFNSTLDTAVPTCLGSTTWYYGVDGLEGTKVELLPVLLHEMGHGLGFQTFTSGSTGNFLGVSVSTPAGFPSMSDHFLFDEASALHWDAASAAQRVASAISTNGLAWDGPGVSSAAAGFLANRPRFLVNSPGGIAGSYPLVTASFGPALTLAGLTGNVVLADDGTPDINDGCTALINAAAVAGNIALINRGTCTFVVKALAAQAAGAIGVIVTNNAAGFPGMGGADPTIVIPAIGITLADGNAIKTALLGGPVNVTMSLDPALKAGADNSGRVLMYAPATFTSGSSVSHFDVSATPNALMEPAINNDLHVNLDMTPGQMADIGWMQFATATTLARFATEDHPGGILVSWEFGDPTSVGAVTVERATAVGGPWEPVPVDSRTVDTHSEAYDANVQADVVYYYRLNVMYRDGQVSTMGMSAARHAGVTGGSTALFAPSPNPARDGAAISFRIGQPEFVRLSIADAQGRHVRTLQNGMMTPGDHAQLWNGLSDNGHVVPAGLYFITMRSSQGLLSRRLAVIR
jgi:hypothetical protein